MNIPVKLRDNGKNMVSAGADVSFEPPLSGKGDYVVLKALQECIVVMSACPQDILKINGQEPKEAHFMVSNT